MMNIQKIYEYFLRKFIPVQIICFDKSSQNIFQSSSYKKVLLFYHKFLNFATLVWILRIRKTCYLLAFFSYFQNVEIYVCILLLFLFRRICALIFTENIYDIIFIFFAYICKYGQSTPQSDRNSVKCVVTSILGIICHSSYLFCVNPKTFNYFETIRFYIYFLNLSFKLNSNSKIKPLNFQRIFREIFFLLDYRFFHLNF